jgi:hypothetical protein
VSFQPFDEIRDILYCLLVMEQRFLHAAEKERKKKVFQKMNHDKKIMM